MNGCVEDFGGGGVNSRNLVKNHQHCHENWEYDLARQRQSPI